MSASLVGIIKALILPPGILLVLFFLCICLYLKRNKLFSYFFISNCLLFYLFSMPAFSHYLSSLFEPDKALTTDNIEKEAGAIVILGCGRYANAPEYGDQDTLSSCGLVRLRFASLLQSKMDLPIFVSGGSVHGEAVSEAELMQNVLVNEWGAENVLLEKASVNTIENADYTSAFLKKQNINTILLVTHAIHIKRAKYLFERSGLKVIPAPTYFYSVPDSKKYFFNFIPSMSALNITTTVFYEMLGYLWVRIKTYEF